ncbi:MAG: BamA/TamA family outer membrane protein [Planctomycetota bacterium]
MRGTAAILLTTAVSVAQQTGTPAPQDPLQPPRAQRQQYDPYRGMDFSGRIPKPEFPDDLEKPERWRYSPPARIKPGGMFERFWVSSFVSPIVFREEDIGFGGGLALTDIDFLSDNYRQFANIVTTYSAEGQQAYRFNWSRWLNHREMPDGGIIREERGRLYARGGYSRTLTRRFFGFGSRAPESNETSYTEDLTQAGFGVRLPVPDDGSDWVARADVDFQHHGLSSGRVSAVPSTNNYLPAFQDAFEDGDGVNQLWLTTRLAWDTRDSLSQAYRGERVGVSAATAWQRGGEWGSIVTLDAQRVLPVPPLFHRGGVGREENPPTDVIAIGCFVQDTVGELPFYSLPTLGGAGTLRGFIQNRFTDRAALHVSAEYRVNIIERGYAFTDTIRLERIGVALFYDGGTVASDWDDLDGGRFLSSYGAGLRLAFSREAVFRVDVGYGAEGSNLTIAFGNAF